MTDRRRPLPARAFALLALASAAFTVYGSLVPFHYNDDRTVDQAVGEFRRLVVERLVPDSRSDFAVNFVLGVPLGFGLLAALRVDRPRDPAKTVLYGLAVWPWTAVFAAAVEFSQLFFRERTCAGSDVLAQSLGSAAGILTWALAGQKLVRWLRGVWTSRRVGGTAGRLLIVYLVLLAAAQLLPLDLMTSPGEVYRKKWKSEETKAVLVPFAEPAAKKLPVWLELAGLYAIAGVLAAGVPAAWNGRILILAPALAVTLEAAQMLVKSRTTSVTDVVIGTAAAWVGYAIARRTGGRPRWELTLLLVQGWAIGLLVGGWLPFDFDPGLAGPRIAHLNWMPFAAAIEKNYLSSLEEMVTKTLLYAPFGAAAGVIAGRVGWGVVVAAGVAALAEGGQLMLPSRTPSPTDLLFAAAGGWLGAAGAVRLAENREMAG